MREYAVIGGGIGGCCAASLLNAKGHDVILFEKEPILGGCASTFKHAGYHYNVGATTLSGYHQGGIVRNLFEQIGVKPKLIATNPAIVVHQNSKKIRRFMNIEEFVADLQLSHPHPKHTEFWHLVYEIGQSFYALDGHYYSNESLQKKLLSLFSFSPMLKKIWPYLWKNARSFIHSFYGGITAEYLDFLDAQILIVAQAKSDSVNFFTAAVSLGYTFNETHYVLGGMGQLCNTLTSRLQDIRKNTSVCSIRREKDRYLLSTKNEIIEAKNIIMGTSHYESSRWFSDSKIQNYYNRYEKLNNYQSAYVLYLTIQSKKSFHHHYQIISKDIIPYTLSNSLFVSFSDASDTKIVPQGYYSITASIHTDSRWWTSLGATYYNQWKNELAKLIQAMICDTLHISTDEVVESFAATPKTFGEYINRTQLGGNALSMKNLLPRIPSNDTPIQGMYHVGDTSYVAQGWPGIAMGAMNLMRLLHV
ncbi:FAD-dependent oxidoreductase [Sulfuricurvum sp.]|uniref:phytoene desaturase family protein n=1 Tax=Sulfuricurvum sp. TaxID=2025608 RepID=UPI0026016D59|nr:FAD-dependent oxidoreductase [Sulfuricurvum sp.]MDD4950437.1 FAD-dependent oxidoreductase [Sulfuricurvum sp.]